MIVPEFQPQFRSIALVRRSGAARYFEATAWFLESSECHNAADIVSPAYCKSIFTEFLRENLRRIRGVTRITDLDLRLAKVSIDAQTVLAIIANDTVAADSILAAWINEEIEGHFLDIRQQIRNLLAHIPRFGDGDFSEDADTETYNAMATSILQFENSLPSTIPFNRLFWDEAYFKGYAYPPDIFRRLQGGTIA